MDHLAQTHRADARLAAWSAAMCEAALIVAPLLLLILLSLAHGWFWPELWPSTWSTRAWSYVISGTAGVGEAFWASASIALLVALLCVAAALPAARVLALDHFRGKNAIWFLLLMPIVTPPLAATMGLHRVFLSWNLTDSVAGVTLAHLAPALPYATLVLAARFRRLNPEWEQQARTLGATPLRVWRHVTLPLLAPAIASAFAFAFLISWSQYLLTLLIGGGSVVTLPLHLLAFQRGGDEAIAAALGVVYLVPAIIVFLLTARGFQHS